MPYEIRFKPSAAEAIRSLPKTEQRRLVRRIEALAREPRPPGCRKLAGADDLYRIRAGDYRVVYAIRDRELLVLVVRVGHRREVYR